MNNEPVAWMNPDESSLNYKFSDECAGDWNIPLYTHPAKTLKLTEKEIEVLWEKYCPFDLTAGIKFARAILRKASEK